MAPGRFTEWYDGDVSVAGPYREGAGGPPCPRCLAPLLVTAEHMSCVANTCGEWWNKDALVRMVDWTVVENAEPYRVFGAVAQKLPCPDCASAMIVSLRAKIEFAHCDAHGVWLDRRERPAFDEVGGWPRVLVSRKR